MNTARLVATPMSFLPNFTQMFHLMCDTPKNRRSYEFRILHQHSLIPMLCDLTWTKWIFPHPQVSPKWIAGSIPVVVSISFASTDTNCVSKESDISKMNSKSSIVVMATNNSFILLPWLQSTASHHFTKTLIITIDKFIVLWS